MPQDRGHRQNRFVPGSEELARRMERREALKRKKLLALKSSFSFRVMNLVNIICFFIYWELILCFFGPCQYELVRPENTQIKYGAKADSAAHKFVREIKLDWQGGHQNTVVVYDYLPAAALEDICLNSGKDFLLQKDLKVRFLNGKSLYRLAGTSPILFLCSFLIVITSIGSYFNLNEQANSLAGLSVFNSLVVVALLFI